MRCGSCSTIRLSKGDLRFAHAICIRTFKLLPLRWFDNRATGDLMTRVIEDVNSVERVLIDGIEQGVLPSSKW